MTIYDLARELNLSASTVSRALRNDTRVTESTRKRIRELAERKGYHSNFHARMLSTRRTNTIGLLLPQLNSSFCCSVLEGVEKQTTAAGYDLIIANSLDNYEQERRSSQRLLQRCDGLIVLMSTDTQSLTHFHPFEQQGVPVVLLNRALADGSIDAVTDPTLNNIGFPGSKLGDAAATQLLTRLGSKDSLPPVMMTILFTV